MPDEIPPDMLAEAMVCPLCGGIRSAFYMEGRNVNYIIACCKICKEDSAWRRERKKEWLSCSFEKATKAISARRTLIELSK
jgi:hypothetical protein